MSLHIIRYQISRELSSAVKAMLDGQAPRLKTRAAGRTLATLSHVIHMTACGFIHGLFLVLEYLFLVEQVVLLP